MCLACMKYVYIKCFSLKNLLKRGVRTAGKECNFFLISLNIYKYHASATDPSFYSWGKKLMCLLKQIIPSLFLNFQYDSKRTK